MESRSKHQVEAAERFRAAKQDRDRRADQHDAARGSAGELPALTELLAAEDKLAAREAWLKWTEQDG